MRVPLFLTAFALLAACSSACSSASPTIDDTSSLPAEVGPARPVTHFSATWKPDTVLLGEEELARSLEDRYSEDGIYRFKPSPELAAKLVTGNVVVLTGVNLVRITDVSTADDAITIHTEQVSLEDAADEADADFSIHDALPDLLPASAATPPTPQALRPLGISSITPDGKSAAFQGTFGDWALNYLYTRTASSVVGQLTITRNLGTFNGKVAGLATVNAMNVDGKLGVKRGKGGSFDLDLDGLDVVFEVNAGLVWSGSGTSLTEVMKIPLQGRIPFQLGPVPMYLGLGVDVELEALGAATSSAFFGVKCHVKGKAHVSSTGAKLSGHVAALDCAKVEPKEYLAPTLDFGVGVRVDLPKMSLGIGIARPLGASKAVGAFSNPIEGYVSVKHEVIANAKILREAAGSFPVITGTCFDVTYNTGVFAGGTFKVGKLELKEEVQLAGKLGPHKQAIGGGKGCPK